MRRYDRKFSASATTLISVPDIFWGPLTMFIRKYALTILSAAVFSAAAHAISAQEWKSGVEWQEPPLVTPGTTNDAPPSDAVVLFNGTNLDQWIDGEN